MLQIISDWMKILLQFANIVIIAYGLYKFLHKPHDTLEDEHKLLEKRVDKLDLEMLEIKKSLDSSHEKHREQKRTNSAFKEIIIAFVNFEIAYCYNTGYANTDELLRAKSALEKLLVDRSDV